LINKLSQAALLLPPTLTPGPRLLVGDQQECGIFLFRHSIRRANICWRECEANAKVLCSLKRVPSQPQQTAILIIASPSFNGVIDFFIKPRVATIMCIIPAWRIDRFLLARAFLINASHGEQ
jgi:hypothetical protein